MKAKLMSMLVVSFAILGLVAAFTAPAQAKLKPIEIVLSTYMPTSYGYLVTPLKHFTEAVEKESGGKVKFKFYHSGQLYKGKEEFAAVERGDIDMTSPLDIYNTKRMFKTRCIGTILPWGDPGSLQKALVQCL